MLMQSNVESTGKLLALALLMHYENDTSAGTAQTLLVTSVQKTRRAIMLSTDISDFIWFITFH